MTKRDLVRYHACDRPAPAALPRRPAGQPPPLPERRRHQGLLAEGGPRPRARLGRRAGATPTPTRARPTSYVVARPPGRPWPGWRTTAAFELHPWTSPTRCTGPADLGADRHRPRDRHDLRRRAGAGPAAPHRPRAPRRRRRAQGQRAARHPDLGAGRRAATPSPRPGPGSRAVAGGRRDRARAGQLGVEEGGPRRAGPTRLHAERRSTRPSSRRSAPGRRPGRRCRCRSRGTSSTTPISRPDRLDDPDRPRSTRRRRRPVAPADRARPGAARL